MLGKRSLYFGGLIVRFSLISCLVVNTNRISRVLFCCNSDKRQVSLPKPPCPPLTTGDSCIIFSRFQPGKQSTRTIGFQSRIFPIKMLHYFCHLQKVKSKE